MTRTPRVLIVAGEASGDLYGGLLMRSMQAMVGSTRPGPTGMERVGPDRPPDDRTTPRFIGAGGPTMMRAGLEALGHAGSLGVTGLFEVAAKLPAIWGVFRRACDVLHSTEDRPELALLIDYPDFNLRLAKRAKRAGVPVVYFVSPQVWAWRRGRVRQIAANVDRMLVILPFEKEFYRRSGVPVEFVGHPLVDLVRATRSREQTLAPLGLDPRRPTVALLPGSRHNEIDAHLGPMVGAATLLREEFLDLQFLLPIAPTVDPVEMRQRLLTLGPERLGIVMLTEGRYDALAACDAAVVASGTATLETALLEVPMVVVYRMNPLTFMLARLASSVPHIGMPNLIVGRRVVPELVQGACRAERIAAELRRILTDPGVSGEMRSSLKEVRARLGAPGAIDKAARASWGMIALRREATE